MVPRTITPRQLMAWNPCVNQTYMDRISAGRDRWTAHDVAQANAPARWIWWTIARPEMMTAAEMIRATAVITRLVAEGCPARQRSALETLAAVAGKLENERAPAARELADNLPRSMRAARGQGRAVQGAWRCAQACLDARFWPHRAMLNCWNHAIVALMGAGLRRDQAEQTLLDAIVGDLWE